jgi:hypothetical protein
MPRRFAIAVLEYPLSSMAFIRSLVVSENPQNTSVYPKNICLQNKKQPAI